MPSTNDPDHSRDQRGGGSTELFAAASFGRISTRRTSLPTPFQCRGCELPVDLLGPCGAFTEPSRPLTFSLSPTGTPESSSFSPDVLSIAGMSTLLPTETGVGLTGRSEDPASPQRFPGKTGQSPKTPSVVFRTFELSPEDDSLQRLFRSRQRARTVSPSTHPRPYVRQATDFLPASALFSPPLDF